MHTRSCLLKTTGSARDIFGNLISTHSAWPVQSLRPPLPSGRGNPWLWESFTYGLDGKIFHWTEAFLSDCQQLVLCDAVKSQYFPVTSRIPQGTPLGPLLFLLHLYDLPFCEKPNTTVRMFADGGIQSDTHHTRTRHTPAGFSRLKDGLKIWKFCSTTQGAFHFLVYN